MSKTLLIVIGLACALVTACLCVNHARRQAAGIMWYNNPLNTARRHIFDKNFMVRYRAIRSLGRLGNKEYIPAITKLLQDDDPGIRIAAAQALCDLDATEAIPEIIKASKKNDMFRRKSLGILLLNNPKGVIPDVIELLRDDNQYVRVTALMVLREFGIKEAIPQIKELLKDKSDLVRSMAEYTLGEFGVEIKEAEENK